MYHAARLALVSSDGTWIVPSELTPRRSSFEFTPIARISTETGSERDSESDRPAEGPRAPAVAGDG